MYCGKKCIFNRLFGGRGTKKPLVRIDDPQPRKIISGTFCYAKLATTNKKTGWCKNPLQILISIPQFGLSASKNGVFGAILRTYCTIFGLREKKGLSAFSTKKTPIIRRFVGLLIIRHTNDTWQKLPDDMNQIFLCSHHIVDRFIGLWRFVQATA